MEKNDLTNEYKTFLEGLENLNLKDFLEQFKGQNSYKEKEDFLNKFKCNDILNILKDKVFLGLFYLDSQAKEIFNKLFFNQEIKEENKKLYFDDFKTLIYCYNTNSREFNKKIEENKLKERLLNEGFIFNDSLDVENLKKLDGIKVKVVMDFNKIGLMGGFSETEEKEGKFFYSEHNKGLMLIPKRSRTKGFLIRGRFYYKNI